MNRIVQNVFFEPWYMSAKSHQSVALVVLNKMEAMSKGADIMAGVPAPDPEHRGEAPEDWDRWLAGMVPKRPVNAIDEDGVAVVHLTGVMSKRVAPIERTCGVVDTDVLRREISGFERQGAKGFLFVARSGGGLCCGTHELSEQIANLSVPTVSFCDEVEGSACYYALCGVDAKFMTKSAEVGSIGTYMGWYDYEELLKDLGYKWNPVISEGSTYKAAGAGPTLSDDHRDYFQTIVDGLNTQFKGQVQTQRPQVEPDAMRGQCLLFESAIQQGIVDYVGEYEDAYDTLLGMI